MIAGSGEAKPAGYFVEGKSPCLRNEAILRAVDLTTGLGVRSGAFEEANMISAFVSGLIILIAEDFFSLTNAGVSFFRAGGGGTGTGLY